jgi:hypothetical protein
MRLRLRYQRALAVGIAALAFAPLARAADDPAKLYDLTIEATPKVAKGAAGSVSVRIVAKGGGELHADTPIKLELSGPKNLALAKDKFTRADVKIVGDATTLEAPFTASDKGKGAIDAKLSFFVCTDKMCARQERTASLPVEVK